MADMFIKSEIINKSPICVHRYSCKALNVHFYYNNEQIVVVIRKTMHIFALSSYFTKNWTNKLLWNLID